MKKKHSANQNKVHLMYCIFQSELSHKIGKEFYGLAVTKTVSSLLCEEQILLALLCCNFKLTSIDHDLLVTWKISFLHLFTSSPDFLISNFSHEALKAFQNFQKYLGLSLAQCLHLSARRMFT